MNTTKATTFHGIGNLGARMMALEGEIERLQAINAEMLTVLHGAKGVIDALMPGIRYIAVQDYQAVNEVPIAIRAAIAKAEGR